MPFPKVAVVTNIPSPYRVLFFNGIAASLKENFIVLYCAQNESNRDWKPPVLNHGHYFLKKRLFKIGNRRIYFNLDVWRYLKEIDPDIIVTGGFTPTMLLAIFFAKFKKKKHFIATDAWKKTEENLSFFHKWLRKVFYTRADALLPVSEKGIANFKSYGVNFNKIFKCSYIVENEKFKLDNIEKKYDLMFSGQFINRKLPFFFIEVASKVQKVYPALNILILGSGPLKVEILKRLDLLNLNYSYPGFIEQSELPIFFNQSRIFLFPTEEDAWGVVVNEACAAGLPVITCENAGCADEIVKNKYNGFILPLDVELWVKHILILLSDNNLYDEFSANSISKISNFSANEAAYNFIKAVNSTN